MKAASLATRQRRLGSLLYEALVILALAIFLFLLPVALFSGVVHLMPGPGLLWLYLFVLLGVYFVWCWVKAGQTLAMKTWHIRVVDREGQPLTQARALWRYVLSWVWFVPPLAVLYPLHLPAGESSVLVLGWVLVWALLSRFQRDRQFWHDVWAGTRLVHLPPQS